MDIPTKKLRNGFEIPVFGLGTWMMGGDFVHNKENNDETDINAIRNAIEAGITHIDTAEAYAEGHAEKLVGEAVKNYEREQLFLVSKVARGNQKPDQVLASCKESLKRLETDYLDLYLLHAPSREVPIEKTMKAMDRLLKEGLIKNIGVSNFTVAQMRRAQEATENKIVANQVHYNLIYREIENEGILEYCQQRDMMVIAWRPVQKGLLAHEGYDVLDKLSKKHDKTPAQVAINWVIAQRNVVAISKMSDKKHLKENLGAVGWELEKKEIETLRDEFPDQQEVSDAVPLEEWS